MPGSLTDEQWRTVLELSHAAAELPEHEHRAFLESAHVDPEITREVLELLGEFSQHDDLNHPGSPFAIPGTQVGRFVIDRCLGQGGMGEVYLARDTELGRIVALKFLGDGAIGFPGAVRTFIREAKTASALNHPNIVTIHEVIRSDQNVAIVMEFVEGMSLRRFCETPHPIDQLLDIGLQIAEALAAAHTLDVVHRDIKPENILVRTDSRVKVLDFGLARQFQESTISSIQSLPAGTLRYMSPEQAGGQPAGTASDVFSFGLTLYEMVAGRHPFPRNSPLETAHAILTAEPQNFPADRRIPSSLAVLNRSMLAKEPGNRPAAAEVAKQLADIRTFLAERPAAEKRSWLRRYYVPAVALVCVCLAAGLLIWRKRTHETFPDLEIQPLTSQPGWEAAPALSSDGQSIAFTWSEKLDRPKEIYVKRPTDKAPVRLTNSVSGNIGYLVWSPDGKRIAFKRMLLQRSGAIYSIDTSGTNEEKIIDLTDANLSSSIDWSPDGSQLAFSDTMPSQQRLAIYLYNMNTGEKRKLTSPAPGLWGDWNPKFSPNGLTIAFKRVTGFWADDIYLVPAGGGSLQQITNMKRGIWGHAWTPDGQSLLVSCQRSGTVFGIWRISIKDPSHPSAIQRGGGFDAITPATARNSWRVAWVNQLWDLNIYRAPIRGTGKRNDAPVKLISSTLRDEDAVYAPDGRIAWISDRSGSREVWIARADGSEQMQVTKFNGPQVDHLQWSGDGRHLGFDSRPSGRADVFILDCEPGTLHCGPAHPLAWTSSAEAPSWSADGRFIYFTSTLTGQPEIWKQRVGGGEPLQVTRKGGYISHESRDGKWLYFTHPRGDSLWRIPVTESGNNNGTSEELVIGSPYRVQIEGWAVTSEEIIFIDRPATERAAAIRAYSPATGNTRTIVELNEVFPDRGDIRASVSPDSRWVLYSQLDRSGSNVFVAENIR